jgi:hypothetical protein
MAVTRFEMARALAAAGGRMAVIGKAPVRVARWR